MTKTNVERHGKNWRAIFSRGGVRTRETIPSSSMLSREEAQLIAERLAPTRGTHKAWGYVYFVKAEAGRIKIGFTTNMLKRLLSLRAASPVGLEVLAVIHGDRRVEASFHERWRHLKLHGEWFESAPDLLSFIGSLGKVSVGGEV